MQSRATDFPIAIIGAGFGGIGMAIRLKQAGIHSFTMFERAGEIGGTWRGLYEFTLAPQTLEDFVALNDVEMKAMSEFLIAARVDGTKRHGLWNTRLNTHENGETTTRRLSSVAELRDVLTGVFGIQLPQSDRLDPALEKVLQLRDDD